MPERQQLEREASSAKPSIHARSRLGRNLGTVLLAVAGAGSAIADFKVLVNSGDQGEQTRGAIYSAWRNLTDVALKADRPINLSWTAFTSTTEDLSGIHTR